MMYLFSILITSFALAATLPPTPFPVFLKEGFSSVLEFEEAPNRVVLGDSQSFQVERLGNSIAIKPLTANAVTNLFVYFSKEPTRLFILTASDEAEPTYFRKFEKPLTQVIVETQKSTYIKPIVRGLKIIKVLRDSKNDYLTADVTVSADSKSAIKPNWNKTILMYDSKIILPSKVWAERKEVAIDSSIKARFVFAKPNLPKNLRQVSLIIPVIDSQTPLTEKLERFGQ